MTRRHWTLLATTLIAVTALTVALVYFRGIPGQTRQHESVGAQAETLRAAFNADIGDVRVLALVSPTCGACLRGASDMQTGVFATISDPRLRGYIVWVPKLDGHENNVDQATHTVADPRASHYWDADGYLVHAYDRTLHLGQDAWDIYLIYPPGVRWDDIEPPAPAYWMTQLGDAEAPALDKAVFAGHARGMLGQM
jgi:hypothetical protein